MRTHYRMDSIVKAGLESMGIRCDANETATFTRQLETILTETYDVLYPQYKGRLFVPVDSRVDPGAELYTYRQFDRQGKMEEISDFADDFPGVEIQGSETTNAIKSFGGSYQYSIQDLRRAQMAGLPLEARKAQAVRDVFEAGLDKIACVGNDNGTITGLANAPNILQTTKGSQATGTGWVDGTTGALVATPAEILADVNAMSRKVFETSLEVHTVDTLVLPTQAYSIIATTPQSPTFTNKTILQYILEQSPWIKTIESWARLNTAGSGGVPRALCYERNARNMGLAMAQEFEQFAPQPRNMAFVIPCHMRTGGVIVRYPKAVTYMDGTVQ